MGTLDSGSKAQDEGESRNHGFCRILLFMRSLGSLG